MIGETHGQYRIDAPLGEGGMGTVFRAIDTKLSRPVAVKFLSEFIADAPTRRRFQREAQMASSLNHPHIVTVFDVGESNGRQYIVTELVDGGTLKDWAAAEKRSWRQIVELLTGVADGLSAAHDAAILHRDVNPPNILVAQTGYAKLADFGLAKRTEQPGALTTHTLTAGPTMPGEIVGTASYMSPEQAVGKPLDARSDIFSFGVVLYELLAGRRPFAADSIPALLYKILHATLDPLPAELPPSLIDLIEKALEKDPADRYQSMRELVVDLRRLTRQSPSATPATPASPPKKSHLPLVAAATVAALLLLAAGYRKLAQSDYFWVNPLDGARFEKITEWQGNELDAAISHDGKFVTFLADRDGPVDMFVTQVGSGQFRNLSEGNDLALLHEMTRTTGFNADGTQVWMRTPPIDLSAPNMARTPILSLMPTMGGSRRPFLTPQSLNPVWSADGTELLFHHSNQGDPIMTAQPDGRDERRVFTALPGEHNHYVTWSPDKKFIYFSRGFRSTEFDIWRVPATGGSAEQLTRHNSQVAYPVLLDNRTLLYRATKEDGSGWAIYGMDVENRFPHRLSLGVEEYQSISASAAGRRLAVTVSNSVASIWRVPITSAIATESAVTKLPLPSAQSKSVRYGRDGILYVSGKGGEGGLWRWKDGAAVLVWPGSAGRVTSGVVPSPDGASLAFSVSQSGRNVLHVSSHDGTGARTLAASLDLRSSPSWSPDGQWLAVAAHTETGSRIFKVPLYGGPPVQLTDTVTFNPVWSPDGSRILYYDGSGGGATFPLRTISPDKQPIPMPKPQVSYRGDYEGYRFLPGGKSIIVLQGQFRAMDFWQVDLTTGERKQLTNLKPGYAIRGFDVSRDGKEILFDRVLENSDVVLVHRKP